MVRHRPQHSQELHLRLRRYLPDCVNKLDFLRVGLLCSAASDGRSARIPRLPSHASPAPPMQKLKSLLVRLGSIVSEHHQVRVDGARDGRSWVGPHRSAPSGHAPRDRSPRLIARDYHGFCRDRMIDIFRGFIAGAEIPPVLVNLLLAEHPPTPFRYRARNGMHRFYASVGRDCTIPARGTWHPHPCCFGPDSRNGSWMPETEAQSTAGTWLSAARSVLLRPAMAMVPTYKVPKVRRVQLIAMY